MPPCATLVPRGPSLRSTVAQKTSLLAKVKTMAAEDDDEERRQERRRRQRQQVVNCCKQVAAFLFSHLGLAAMVVTYSIMGGFLFRAIEAPAEVRDNRQQVTKLVASKTRLINDVLDVIADVCDPTQTTATTRGNVQFPLIIVCLFAPKLILMPLVAIPVFSSNSFQLSTMLK